jgi:hypothetical protein
MTRLARSANHPATLRASGSDHAAERVQRRAVFLAEVLRELALQFLLVGGGHLHGAACYDFRAGRS